MPVRDAGALVDEAIRSILSQTLSSLELVAIDDGSRDDTPDRLAAWRDHDPRVRVVPSLERGLVGALNTGLGAARAPLIARMDADDVAHPRRLELQDAFFRTRGDLAVVSCLVESVPRSEVREGYRIYERWLNALIEPSQIAREIYVESPIAHPTAFACRDAILDAGGYRDDGGPEDYDLWLRLHARGHRFAKVREVLHHWRDHAARASRNDPRYALERFLATKARHLRAGPLADREAIVWGAGMIGRRLSRRLLAEGARIRGFIDIDPKKIGRRLGGRPILAPSSLPPAGDAVVLSAVGSRHARALIRRRLLAAFYREGRDFFCAA